MKESNSLLCTIKNIATVVAGSSYKHVHGLASCLFIILCVASAFAFFSTNATINSLGLDLPINIACLFMVFGLFGRKMRLRLRNANKRSFFLRVGSWNVAFAGLMMSYYTKKSPFDPMTAQQWIGSILWILGTVVASITIWFDCRQGTILKGMVSASSTSTTFLLTMPVLHHAVGTARLAELYSAYPIAEGVYIFCLITAFVNAWDSFMAGMAWAGHMTFDQYHIVAVMDWAIFFNTAVVLAFWWLQEGRLLVAVVYFIISSVLFGVSTALEKVILARGKSYGNYSEYKTN